MEYSQSLPFIKGDLEGFCKGNKETPAHSPFEKGGIES